MAVPTVSSRTFAHTVVIVLRGHVDETGTHQLRRELINALMRKRRRIVVDFARATSLDATAVGALIAAHDTAPDMHLTLTLRNPSVGIAAELAEHGLLEPQSSTRRQSTRPPPAKPPPAKPAPVTPPSPPGPQASIRTRPPAGAPSAPGDHRR